MEEGRAGGWVEEEGEDEQSLVCKVLLTIAEFLRSWLVYIQ